jgi:hypothetical protein
MEASVRGLHRRWNVFNLTAVEARSEAHHSFVSCERDSVKEKARS